eukprot:6277818-Pyramimonas_sp.AAC.1
MAFDPYRGRAWVVGLKPIGCSLGTRGGSPGTSLRQLCRPLGGRSGASWGLFGASFGPLGGLLG